MTPRTPGVAIVAMVGGLTLASLLAVSSASAQESPSVEDAPAITGFADAARGAQEEFEQALLDAIHSDSIGRWARTLAMRPHVAGTPGQVATRDSVIGWHTAGGIDAGYDSLMLYMPHPLSVSVERTWPEPMVFDLVELQGMTGAEAARLMSIEPVTVRANLFKARRAMRARILERRPDIVEDLP